MQPIEEIFLGNEMGLEVDFFENWLDETKNMVYTHWHDRLEFIYVVEGEGALSIDLEEHQMEQGDIFIIMPRALHSVKGRGGKVLHSKVIVFHSDIVFSEKEEGAEWCFEQQLTSKKEGYLVIKGVMGKLFELRSHRYLKSKLLFQGLLTELCGWLCYYGYQNERPEGPAAGNEVLKLVLTYMREHLNEKLEVADMARLAGYSKYHFIRFFSESVGCPCVQYIHMLRIQQAKKLLRETKMGVAQISGESGFESVSYFIQIFKRSENCTPGHYRKMLQEKRGIK